MLVVVITGPRYLFPCPVRKENLIRSCKCAGGNNRSPLFLSQQEDPSYQSALRSPSQTFAILLLLLILILPLFLIIIILIIKDIITIITPLSLGSLSITKHMILTLDCYFHRDQ